MVLFNHCAASNLALRSFGPRRYGFLPPPLLQDYYTMNRSHSTSSDLFGSTKDSSDDSSLEGVAANVKLLLKLISDHKEACSKDKKDGRRMLRVAGMMTILDMVRSRIQKCQSFGLKKSPAQLRRCNTDLREGNVVKEKKVSDLPTGDEKEKLKKQINAGLAARKSLEVMCSSLGKEKEIMAHELARKAHQVNGMEDYINDLKAQNETLLEKVQEYTSTTDDNREIICEKQEISALEERNKKLSEQLLKAVEGYRSTKRKLEKVKEENDALRGVFLEMEEKLGLTLQQVRGFKQKVASGCGQVVIKEEISELEQLIKSLDVMVLKDR